MNYYDEHAKEYITNTINADMSEAYGAFLKYIKKECKILDLGCGSGRDSFYFKKLGFWVDSLEPSHEICEILRKNEAFNVIESTIQNFFPIEKYDGIWACASLLHLTRDDLFEFFDKLDQFLLPNGILYFSGKKGIQTGIAKDGRYFLEFRESLLEELFQKNQKIKVLKIWESLDVTGRQDFTWLNVIIQLDA